MAAPTDEEIRQRFAEIAGVAIPQTQVLLFWALTFEPGDDMTVLRSSQGRVDTLMISAAGIEQSEPPRDASRMITTPRGKNVVGRRYRTWLFNENETALMAVLEAWRRGINSAGLKLGFDIGKSEFVESVSRLQVPLIDNFPTGDAVTPVACFAEAYVTVRVIEPQG